MGEDPRDVEQRIENTRERMGDTVEALSAKADVPGRVKGYMEDKKDAVTSKVSDAKEKVTGAAGSVGENGSHAAGQAAQAARKSAGIAKENPLGLAIGSVAAGFLLGMALPTSRIEDEHLGPLLTRSRTRHGTSEARPSSTARSSHRPQPKPRRKPAKSTPATSRRASANLLGTVEQARS